MNENPLKRGLVILVFISALFASFSKWKIEKPLIYTSNKKKNAPVARLGHHMTYDEKNKRVLLFGGSDSSGRLLGDLWAWDGSSWTQLSAADSLARESGVLVYDSYRNRSVLFGGRFEYKKSNITFDDTHEWDGKTWHRLNVKGPPARIHQVAAFDKKRKKVFLFGGIGPGNRFYGDTWTWDGACWKRVDTALTNQFPQAMLYDELNQSLILITYKVNSRENGPAKTRMWEWTGSTWKLSPVLPPQIEPIQSFCSLGTKGGFLIFDGQGQEKDAGVTWRWNTRNWEKLSESGPTKRKDQVMVFDNHRNKIVLFGGGNNKKLNDVWEWEGNQWIQK